MHHIFSFSFKSLLRAVGYLFIKTALSTKVNSGLSFYSSGTGSSIGFGFSSRRILAFKAAILEANLAIYFLAHLLVSMYEYTCAYTSSRCVCMALVWYFIFEVGTRKLDFGFTSKYEISDQIDTFRMNFKQSHAGDRKKIYCNT